MSTGAWIAVIAIAVALAFGLFRMLSDGRFRGTKELHVPHEVHKPEPHAWDAVSDALGETELGARATLVQFSSAFCAPCRATRRILGEVAEIVPGVVHLEIDAEHHLDLVRRLDILRTPTTLVIDGGGYEIARATGAPRKEQVLSAIPTIDLES
ncbi:thioredoxin family protein [Nocardioides panzhihuensis]|uniref:Thiol-disulfide isomerase/thioredoxin n=1 Tax=Nocardioides panzhihuensis TaxID=860243 RepID=A0A7Z0ITV9_9ACTN|nr:thioredoxin family protein [Nocardioides panzhihuensis]NYI79564.1 thiol-disulfide isomerase/thioredoxin [Nocardioides panzhihuensis]